MLLHTNSINLMILVQVDFLPFFLSLLDFSLDRLNRFVLSLTMITFLIILQDNRSTPIHQHTARTQRLLTTTTTTKI
jgi:hypothetical protein